MYSIETKDLSQKDLYFLMIGGISPRPIAFVSTISKDGIYNLAPFAFFNAFGTNPPIVIFSPTNTADPERPHKDTYINLMDTKECVVQIISYDFAQKAVLTGQEVPADVDEFKLSGLTPIPSDIVKAPRVKESRFQMECKLMEMKSIGNGPGMANLAICEIVKFHVDENIFKEGSKTRIDPHKLDAIGRNGEYNFTRASGDAIFEMRWKQ